MNDDTSDSTLPTLEFSIEHLEKYVRGLLDVGGFWQPFPDALEAYADFANDPHDRLPYYWRMAARAVGNIIRLGYPEDQDFRDYMRRWLDALRMDTARWDDIVQRKGRPLQDNVEDWDL